MSENEHRRAGSSKVVSYKHLFCAVIGSLVFLTGISALYAEEKKPINEDITWWVAADPHVGHRSEPSLGEHLATSVADVNELGIAEYAVMLGDLVDDSYDHAVPFIREMNQLDVNWTYVLGNHDFVRDVNEPVLPVHFSARTVGGIRFVFLSDELTGARDRDLVMSEEQENWFWEEMETHKDKQVFLFTHQPHPEFQRWPELKEKIEEYNVAAWFSGHKHRWDLRQDSGHGFAIVNIHSIGGVREDYLSTFLGLNRDQDRVKATVRFRNHKNKEWISVDGEDVFIFHVDL